MSRQVRHPSKTLQIRVSSELHERFLDRCYSQGVGASEVTRQLIEAYCKEKGVTSSVTQQPKQPLAHNKSDNENADGVSLTLGEMYSGPGGLGLGATNSSIHVGRIRHNFEPVWATDFDPDTCQTYARNVASKHEGMQVICRDIRELEISQLPKVDGLLFGFPCNDFSVVGESKGLKGEYGPLYRYGVKYLDHAEPKFFLAENVSGLSSANSGKAFETILRELSGAGKYGYELAVHLYKFEDYGVPQTRHRIIVLGIRGDLDVRFQIPRPMGERVSAQKAIESPPILDEASNNERTVQSRQVVARLKHIRPGENAWTAKLPKALQLNVRGAKLSHIYKRLDPTKPSYTVTGSGGGGTHVYHWEENRALTNRERARLQTFPDDFTFLGSKESVRKQIGMAVPPKAAEIILTAVLKTFACVAYDAVEPRYGRIEPLVRRGATRASK